MGNFRINSGFFWNIFLIGDKEITNCMCTININNEKEIELPLLVAISCFSSISQSLMSDITQRNFNLTVDFSYPTDSAFYDKLIEILNNQEVELNDQETLNLASIGEVAQNREFIMPLEQKLEEQLKSLSLDNCFELIETKHKFHFDLSKLVKEIEFVSANFETQKEKIISMANDVSYLQIIAEILKSNKLKIMDEDSLIDFVLSLCSNDKCYEALFEFVYLEYCSIEKIEEFIKYIETTIETTNSILSIFKCMKRRLLEPKIPKIPSSLEDRHIKIYVTDDDPYKGILYIENQKGNVTMKESTQCCGNAYNLLKGNSQNDFDTNSDENSWIEASLKQDKPFLISKYMIRGSNNRLLRNWKLEGKRKTDNQWIPLDKHENDEISQYQLRVFPVDCDEILTAVRLTQTGKNNENNYRLRISSFDIFGEYEPF